MEDDRLAQGFRFYPTEEELVSFYLQKKLEGRRQDFDRVIPVLYIYDFNPWDLPRQGIGCMDASSSSREFAGEVCREDPDQWFFFIPRQENEARGGRPNRLTTSGYWKATGSPGYVFSSHNRIIGMKRTMVFYKGRAPSGRKTEWKMNEYRAIEGEPSSSITTIPPLRQEFTLCRVYKRAIGNRLPSAAAAATATSDVTVEQAHYGGGGGGGGDGGGGGGGDGGGDHANPSQNMAHWQVIAGMLVGLTMKL